MKIKNIQAREILDSRGIPTISTEIELWSGEIGVAEVPSGASTGKTEVLEMRDEDSNRHNGKGVLKAVNIINTTIKNLVVDREFTSQREFDELLIKEDSTELKTKLGGNTILSCSMAFARAISNEFSLNLYEYLGMIYWDKEYSVSNFKMPTPLILVMEGAKHGNWATDVQEYMIVPNSSYFKTFSEKIEASVKVYKQIGKILSEKNYSTGVGFEGAYAPRELKTNQEAFNIIIESINKSNYKVGEHFSIALDIASSEFYSPQSSTYNLKKENRNLSPQEWNNFQMEWYKKYSIVSVEDPFDQDDWDLWSKFTQEYGKMGMVVGDDLLTTNVERIKMGIEKKAINTVLIKPNQIGTISETLQAIRVAEENGLNSIISHRSGETNDSFIADLVVGTPSKFAKFGGLNRGERLSKYNRLLEIEKTLTKILT